jgi:hypothetical protein
MFMLRVYACLAATVIAGAGLAIKLSTSRTR